MINKGEILKDAPDYDKYTENEAILTIEEQREFGLLKCGGCCSKGNGGCKKGCCKSR